MKKVFEVDEVCPDCKGTGVYVGLAERDGSAVVCCKCKGTGCFHFKHEYEEFEVRRIKCGVSRVVRANPGICIGTGNGHKLEDFGGMLYADWLEGKPFPPGSEMREFTCPAWFYQTADYTKKPNWDMCRSGGYFSDCQCFCNKDRCWKRWDKEFGGKANA